jgi:pimeloyl-ACP methyl ester carboxylesterase
LRAAGFGFGVVLAHTPTIATLHTSRFAELPGVRLWYADTLQAAQGTAGSAGAIVFLHAFTGTHESFLPQLEAFATAGYRAIAFDRRGWGQSTAEPRTGPQPGYAADDLNALCDHLRLDRFHLVGVAAGAQVALDYAAWQGARLRSLVLAASLGPGANEPEIAAFSARIAIPGLQVLPADYREVGASYRGANPEGVQAWLQIAARARQANAAPQPFRSPNRYAKLAEIDVPALVLAGGADLLSPPALMRLWAAHLPRAEWSLIPEAGHALNTEQPEAFNAEVLRFVCKHGS